MTCVADYILRRRSLCCSMLDTLVRTDVNEIVFVPTQRYEGGSYVRISRVLFKDEAYPFVYLSRAPSQSPIRLILQSSPESCSGSSVYLMGVLRVQTTHRDKFPKNINPKNTSKLTMEPPKF